MEWTGFLESSNFHKPTFGAAPHDNFEITAHRFLKRNNFFNQIKFVSINAKKIDSKTDK